jgi:putative phosphoribosyl transferase
MPEETSPPARASPELTAPSPRELAVHIPSGKVLLDADLVSVTPGAGIVIFAHGSGSGRKSPRNRQVAARLHSHGLGTLLLDLLAAPEARADEVTAEYRFDIPLLTERLLSATDWLVRQSEARGVRIGYFGASTGGAVAMIAAARRAAVVRAIVLRGARSDLGDAEAARIRCPTLILVGGDDAPIRDVNAKTMRLLRCEKELVVVPGASHLFEEPGALEVVADRAAHWFEQHLAGVGR